MKDKRYHSIEKGWRKKEKEPKMNKRKGYRKETKSRVLSEILMLTPCYLVSSYGHFERQIFLPHQMSTVPSE